MQKHELSLLKYIEKYIIHQVCKQKVDVFQLEKYNYHVEEDDMWLFTIA